jgi:hypothetical protein
MNRAGASCLVLCSPKLVEGEFSEVQPKEPLAHHLLGRVDLRAHGQQRVCKMLELYSLRPASVASGIASS